MPLRIIVLVVPLLIGISSSLSPDQANMDSRPSHRPPPRLLLQPLNNTAVDNTSSVPTMVSVLGGDGDVVDISIGKVEWISHRFRKPGVVSFHLPSSLPSGWHTIVAEWFPPGQDDADVQPPIHTQSTSVLLRQLPRDSDAPMLVITHPLSGSVFLEQPDIDSPDRDAVQVRAELRLPSGRLGESACDCSMMIATEHMHGDGGGIPEYGISDGTGEESSPSIEDVSGGQGQRSKRRFGRMCNVSARVGASVLPPPYSCVVTTGWRHSAGRGQIVIALVWMVPPLRTGRHSITVDFSVDQEDDVRVAQEQQKYQQRRDEDHLEQEVMRIHASETVHVQALAPFDFTIASTATVWDGVPVSTLSAHAVISHPPQGFVHISGQELQIQGVVSGIALGPGTCWFAVSMNGRRLGRFRGGGVIRHSISSEDLGIGSYYLSLSIECPPPLPSLPPIAKSSFRTDSFALSHPAPQLPVTSTPPSPRLASARIHTLPGLLRAYGEWHAHSLAKADPNMRLLVYTPPGYGWGNRMLDLSACLLTALTTDRVLLVNWSDPQKLSDLASPSTFDWGGHADLAASPLHSEGGAADPFGFDQVVHLAHNLRSLPSRVYSWCASEGGDSAAVLSIVGDYTGEVIGTLLSAMIKPSPGVSTKISSLARGLRDHQRYIGIHIRRSGEWDPAGFSEAGLFAMRQEGEDRAMNVAGEMLEWASKGHKQDGYTRLDDDGAGKAIFLATDSPATRARWLRGRLGDSIAVSTSRVAHTAGPQRKGGVGGKHEEERGEDHEEEEVLSSSPYSTEDRGYKVGERRDDVGWAVAEWWVIASATQGFVLTRGSSFGLTAAALGLACSSKSLINAATPHPVVPGSPCSSTSEVYTVWEHKVERGLDCAPFEICNLSTQKFPPAFMGAVQSRRNTQ